MGEHSDYLSFTILSADDIIDLQVYYHGDDCGKRGWVDVPSNRDAFVINAGLWLKQVTNVHWRASAHRVAVTTLDERLSMLFFTRPNFDAIIEPLPNCYVCNE